MTQEHSILTHLQSGGAEMLRPHDSHTVDQIIVIREALHSMQSNAVCEVQIDLTTKNWTLKVMARRG